MISKAVLHVFVFFWIVVLTACGPAATEVGGTIIPVQTSDNTGASGLSLTICLGLAVVVVPILFILSVSILRRKKTGTGETTSAADKNKPSERPTQSQPKPLPATPPADVKRATPKVDTSSHIFISYRRSDSADIAGRIYDRLTGKFGRKPIFKDVDSIPLGLDFREYLDAKVSECVVLLAIIGDRWLQAKDETGKARLNDPGDFVRIEIESALARGIPVIPLLVRGARMPAEEKLPGSLRKLVYRNGIQIRSDPDFHRDMDRLIAALEQYIQS